MNFDYSNSGVLHGRANQNKARETPSSFATSNGVTVSTQRQNLDQPKQRMAGEMGYRLQEYLNDPVERDRTDRWMERFGLSNEGMAFNQAKMGGAPEEEMQ